MLPMCKMVISPGVCVCVCVFFFFHFFKILIWNNTKFCLSHCKSQKPHIICLSFMVHICKMIISPGFFRFFKILIFCYVRGVKWQKMVQINIKFCLSCSISQELYIIWLSFMVHICKMIISPGTFLIFSKFWFSGLLKV